MNDQQPGPSGDDSYGQRDDGAPYASSRSEEPLPVAYTQPLPGYNPPVPAPYPPAPPLSPAPYPHVALVQNTGYAGPQANAAHMAVAWIFTVLSFGYFLPWAIAATRGKQNSLAIALLNFLLGWTVIGWIAALVMACSSEAVHVNNVAVAVAVGTQPGWQPAHQPSTYQQSPPPGWYPQGTGQRYWDGQRWTEHTSG